MTNTTDIAVLYAVAVRAEETGTSFVIPAETAISLLTHIGVLRDNLEAERQRAEIAKSALDSMTRQRDEVERLRVVLCDDKENLIDKCIERDKEIAALKAKLANPVVLKPAYRQSEYNRLGLEPSDAYGLAWGSSATRDDCVKQIRDAGFTVKEG